MRKRGSVLLVIFLLFSIFILTLQSFPPTQIVEGLFQSLARNPKSALFLWSKSFRSSQPDMQKLQDENQKLESQFVDYENIKKDNVALRSQFQDTVIPSTQLLPADIIGFNGDQSHPSELYINRGKDNKLHQGMVVVVGHNLIGKLQSVTEHISSVMTITNKNFNTSAKSLQDNALGVVHGEDDFLLFDQVVITDTLKQDDLVVTRGDSNFPESKVTPNIIVGKITSISKSETAAFQSAKVESLVDYSKLANVFVLFQ